MVPASLKIPMERFDPFRVQSAPIIVDRRKYRSSGCPCGSRRSPLRKTHQRVRALSIIGPAGGNAPRPGKSPRPAPVPFNLGTVLVAKNLHLTDFLLIFRRDSAEIPYDSA